MDILYLFATISSAIAAAFTIIAQFIIAMYQREQLASQNAEVRRALTMLEIKIEDIQRAQQKQIGLADKNYDYLYQIKKMLYESIDKNKTNDKSS